jgi:hypothetical protein
MAAVGDPVYPTDFSDLLPTNYVKSAQESRNTTTTYADDGELAGIPLAVGTYEVELVLFFTLTTTATQKIKTHWAFSGTWNNPVRACVGPGSNQTAAPNVVTEMNTGGYQAAGQDAIYDQAAGASFGTAREIASNVTISVAGNLSLQWAQVASSGNNTNVQLGTFFRIRKLP